MVALLTRVRLVVLIAHFQIFNPERFRVSVLGTHGTILRCDGAISIFQGIHALVNPRLDAVVRRHTTMPYSDIHNIEWLGTQVFCQLQVFMKAQSVGSAIAPIHIPVSFTFLYRTDGTLPAESVVRTLLPLHETASREAHELRVHLPKHIGKIGTHAVLTVLEGGWEKTHHVYLHLSYTIEHQCKLRLSIVFVGGKGGFILRPAFGAIRK